MTPVPIRAILRTVQWKTHLAFQWWDTGTGKSFGGVSVLPNDDNIYQAIFHVNGGFWDNGIFFYREKLNSQRDWKSVTSGFELVDAVTSRQIADWIKDKLVCTI